MTRGIAAWVAAVAVAVVVGLIAAPAAQATFHLMQIREVYAGSAASPEAKYVELQMYASGQNHVGGHTLRIYNAGGSVTSTTIFGADVANGANQSTILLATPQAKEQFGVEPDIGLSTPAGFIPSGGAACWEELDCVSWGNFSGSLPSPAGSPASPGGIPDGMALQRTIARGCATNLSPADDTGDSAADFSAVAPQPRPNSVAPTEQACASEGGSGSGSGNGGGSSGGGAPQTTLRRKPPKRTTDRTPTFRFGSDESGSKFECRLDKHRFRACRSPFSAKTLPFGPHHFQVRARDSQDNVDPTPASYGFRVVRAS
jgi:uncharacterized membrane protein YgcG